MAPRDAVRSHQDDGTRDPHATLERIGLHWWSAFDAADAALHAAGHDLPAPELRELRTRLVRERSATAHELQAVARTEGTPAHFSHLLVPRAGLRGLLQLPSAVSACVFNLDGVLVNSAALHAAAWAETFDEFLSARLERTGGRFAPADALAPFDERSEYMEHLHGRTRLEGVRAFLASRGISLPEGDPGDEPGAETVHGLARRKSEALLRRVSERGAAALEDASRYLQLAREAGVHSSVVSASVHTEALLRSAGLADLIEQSVDGNAILAGRLRARPAPDILLDACRLLGVEPARAAAFETSLAGVAAARAGGFALVIGVDSTGRAAMLRARGAHVVIRGLTDLLERSRAA
jgi:HAD superfamily hydrolase (TIGR01509 family)